MLELEGVRPPPERNAVTRVTEFARPYLLGLGYSIVLFAVGWTTWRGRAAIVDLCSRLGYRHDTHEPIQLHGVAPDSVTAMRSRSECWRSTQSTATLPRKSSLSSTSRCLVRCKGYFRARHVRRPHDAKPFRERWWRWPRLHTGSSARISCDACHPHSCA
jgi:hypothetical protein